MPQSPKPSRARKNPRPAGAARKPRPRRSWLKTVLFFLLFPLVVWFVAFLTWFYWYNLVGIFSQAEDKTKAAPKNEISQERREKSPPPPAKASAEKILDEERQKLDDILKQRP